MPLTSLRTLRSIAAKTCMHTHTHTCKHTQTRFCRVWLASVAGRQESPPKSTVPQGHAWCQLCQPSSHTRAVFLLSFSSKSEPEIRFHILSFKREREKKRERERENRKEESIHFYLWSELHCKHSYINQSSNPLSLQAAH